MSSELNAFFIETAVNQGWLSAEQVAAVEQSLAADLSPFREGESATQVSACDFLLQQGWLGQEHVDWLQQMAALQTAGKTLSGRTSRSKAAADGGGVHSPQSMVPSTQNPESAGEAIQNPENVIPAKAGACGRRLIQNSHPHNPDLPRYETGEMIAKGGMGAVFRVKDLHISAPWP